MPAVTHSSTWRRALLAVGIRLRGDGVRHDGAHGQLRREPLSPRVREVLDAGDVRPAMRLSNKIAKHRASRYLADAGRLFASPE